MGNVENYDSIVDDAILWDDDIEENFNHTCD